MEIVYGLIAIALALFAWDVIRRLVLADERTVIGFAAVTAALGVALTVLWHVHP
jgi:hypothetical protein